MGMKAPANTWKLTARGDCPDWSAIRDRVDLAAITTAFLGLAPGRRGEKSRRWLYWPCPFHDDKNPSLCVDPRKRRWKCFGCGAYGDAATLVMKKLQVLPDTQVFTVCCQTPKFSPSERVGDHGRSL